MKELTIGGPAAQSGQISAGKISGMRVYIVFRFSHNAFYTQSRFFAWAYAVYWRVS